MFRLESWEIAAFKPDSSLVACIIPLCVTPLGTFGKVLLCKWLMIINL